VREDVHAIGGVRGEVGAATPKPGLDTGPKLVTSVGPPQTPDEDALAKGGAVTIDAVVGQINGRPVLVSEILEPLDGTLRAASREAKNLGAWQHAAAEAIVRELKRRIEDELILSEARSGLSPEQKAGLFRFLKTIESNLISAQKGSEVAADETYREQSGRSLRAEAEDQKDRMLITNELRSKVLPRVVVSWRDVQNEYDRQQEKFNPAAKYTFRMVYASGDDTAAVAKITEALTAATPFEEIARSPANEFNNLEGGLMSRTCAGSQGDCTFSPVSELNTAMHTLHVGQTIGPVIYVPDKSKPDAQRIAWVYLERIDLPQGKSLYDAQLDIETELREERTSAEIGRYFDRLRKRGNVSKIEVMGEKLMAVATDRYAPQFVKK
jgi:hypothetical protein